MTQTHRQDTLLRIAGLLSLLLLPPPAQAGIALLSDTVKDPGQVMELGVDLGRNNFVDFDTLDADGNLKPGNDRTTAERPFRSKEGAEWEFVRDVLSLDPFEWIIKGTDLGKVATKMKQTLGVVKVQGRDASQLHPVLEEALRRGRIKKADLERIIAQIDSGELLRVQGY